MRMEHHSRGNRGRGAAQARYVLICFALVCCRAGLDVVLCRCPICRSIIPGWDGKGGGEIGLKVRVIFSFDFAFVWYFILAFAIHFSKPKLARWHILAFHESL